MFSSRNKKNVETVWLKKTPYQELCNNFSINMFAVLIKHFTKALLMSTRTCFYGKLEKIIQEISNTSLTSPLKILLLFHKSIFVGIH